MKKENRKMAQERRAKERRKKELRRKISKIIVIAIPLIAVIALIIAIIVTSGSADSSTSSGDAAAESSSGTDDSTEDSTEDTDAEDTSGTDDSADSTAYSTDSSLTVEDGDTVNIDYVGSVDGVEFDGGNTQGMGTDLVIGSGSYIDDFEEQLIGAHPGDEVDVYVTFPDPYQIVLSGFLVIWIETVPQILIKVLKYLCLRCYFHCISGVICKQRFQFNWRHNHNTFIFKIFPKRESIESMERLPSGQICYRIVNRKHSRTGIDDVQIRIIVIEILERHSPALESVHFIEIYVAYTSGIQEFDKLFKIVAVEPQVVKGDIECIVYIAECFLDMLHKHSRLADAACTFYPYKPHIPVNLVIKIPLEPQVGSNEFSVIGVQ